MNGSRREFFRTAAVPAVGVSLSATGQVSLSAVESNAESSQGLAAKQRCWTIGLSQHSLHNMIAAGDLDLLDYPAFAINAFGLDQIDLCSSTLPPGESRTAFLRKLRGRSERAGTNIFLIRDHWIRLTADTAVDRNQEIQCLQQAVVQAHVAGAKYLSVLLDAGDGSLENQAARAVDGLRRLADYAATQNVTILVESGSGSARNGLWLARIISAIDHPYCGSMPEFGKFGKFDRYAGTEALLDRASVISAKTQSFRDDALELQSDYPRLFQMIVDARFHGVVAIEYEGDQGEAEGVRATQKLLQRLRETSTT